MHLHFKRAADGFLHAMAIAEKLEEPFDVGHGRIGSASEGHDFPQEDAERPHVRLAGIDALEQRFRGHPFDRQSSISRFAVILVHVHVPRQTEIGDFQDAIVADQDVAGRQIPVDALNQYKSHGFTTTTTTKKKHW